MIDVESSLLGQLLAAIADESPLQERSLREARANLLPDEAAELESYLSLFEQKGQGIAELVKAYQTITLDTLREQVYFRRHGRYRHSTFAEVADRVYFDPSYMTQYMYGLALTLYLWPNHLEIVRYFRRMLPQRSGGRYLEIGPGHGVFLKHAARHGGFDSCLGIDLSPTSLELTKTLLQADPWLGGVEWRLMLADFLAAPELVGGYDAIVMGEVLEHVEEPLRFLERIKALALEDAFIFVSTAVNAPAIDHIHLFPSVQSVYELINQAGLKVVDCLAVPYHGTSMAETVEQKLPINVALVLSR
jgi:2-polyprenyl-3-methyl-5-hydroxy-6-metoxy-1,4-benzoquinol methylase